MCLSLVAIARTLRGVMKVRRPLPALVCIAVAAALLGAGCAKDAAVRERRPEFHAATTGSAAQSGWVARFRAARARAKAAPLVAVGEYLKAASEASQRLAADLGDTASRDAYNFAVARVLGTIQDAGLDPWTKPLPVPGGFTLSHRRDRRPEWNPARYDFVPADQFDVRGSYVAEQVVKPGVGAPTVAIGRAPNHDFEKNFGMPRTYYGVTAVIRFNNGAAELAFEDPLATEDVQLAGRRMPLAADFTVPLAVLLEQAKPQKMEVSRLLRPEKYAHTARISRLQPYDPNKTVVLVIHGLMDTPATWTPLINALRADETLRRNYQFWFYSYPSGYPYPYSAAILRENLDAARARFPMRKPIVVIGHSMGGCIGRLLITDPGDLVWRDIFGRAPADTPMTPAARRIFTKALLFRNRPEVGRVIFMAAPLRGSGMAVSPLGRIGSSLVRTPEHLLEAGANAVSLMTFQTCDLQMRRIPNSVDTLAPNSRFVRAINKVPMVKGVPVNVISGDRGKGGNKDRTKPQMSDGIVPYWSSHIAEAESEKIVASDHSVHQNRDAIAEVARILKKQAGR